MSSGGGTFIGPERTREDWTTRFQKSLPGLVFEGARGHLKRNGGFIDIDLGDVDPQANIEVHWSGIGPGAAVRRVAAEHGLKANVEADEPATPASPVVPAVTPSRATSREVSGDLESRRSEIVTSILASVGAAIILLAALFVARPSLEARLIANNESLAIARLREIMAGVTRETPPVYAGFVFEPYSGSISGAVRARPLIVGKTGGGWLLLSRGRILRDPGFDALISEGDEP